MKRYYLAVKPTQYEFYLNREFSEGSAGGLTILKQTFFHAYYWRHDNISSSSTETTIPVSYPLFLPRFWVTRVNFLAWLNWKRSVPTNRYHQPDLISMNCSILCWPTFTWVVFSFVKSSLTIAEIKPQNANCTATPIFHNVSYATNAREGQVLL